MDLLNLDNDKTMELSDELYAAFIAVITLYRHLKKKKKPDPKLSLSFAVTKEIAKEIKVHTKKLKLEPLLATSLEIF